jgi:thiamine biosynthesis lipoprotein
MSDIRSPDTRYPSRREMIALGIGAFVVAAAPFARGRRRLARRTIPVMGTIGEIAVVHRDPVYAHAAIDAGFAELRRVERLMTRFASTSDVGRVNSCAARDVVRVSPDTAHVVRAAIAWAEGTDGQFDPCLGRVAELWDVEHRHVPPPASGIHRLAGRGFYRLLDVDGAAVRLTDRDAALDLGGIGKGYGVDRAVAALRDWGITQAFVNVGGDLYALGGSEDGDSWKVGIQSPSDPSGIESSFRLSDAAVATSGDYLRYFDYGGRRYHHLFDPATGAPRQSAIHSVTIRADRCLTADAAATAAFGLSASAAVALLRRRAPDAEVVRVL